MTVVILSGRENDLKTKLLSLWEFRRPSCFKTWGFGLSGFGNSTKHDTPIYQNGTNLAQGGERGTQGDFLKNWRAQRLDVYCGAMKTKKKERSKLCWYQLLCAFVTESPCEQAGPQTIVILEHKKGHSFLKSIRAVRFAGTLPEDQIRANVNMNTLLNAS